MKIVDESILFFSRVSLSKFSLEALYNTWVWGVFILVCVWNAKGLFFPNIVVWWLDLVTWLRHESKSRANCLARLEVLSYNAPAGVTLHLLCMLHTCASFGNLYIYKPMYQEFDDELSATEIAYLAKNFRNFLRNNNKRAREIRSITLIPLRLITLKNLKRK